MKIYLREISENERNLEFSAQSTKDDWVRIAVARVDENPDAVLRPGKSKAKPPQEDAKNQPLRPIQCDVNFTLRKLDELYEVTGKFSTSVRLVCSRCGKPFEWPCENKFASLFTTNADLAGLAQVESETGRLLGARKGVAFSTEMPNDTDYDITHLREDFLDLGDVLTEQIQLQVPYQPLCKKDCQGLCSICGIDLNVEKCSCDRTARNRPFAHLKQL